MTLIPSLPFLNAANVLLIAGSIILVVSFIGFYGAIKEHSCMLLTVGFFLKGGCRLLLCKALYHNDMLLQCTQQARPKGGGGGAVGATAPHFLRWKPFLFCFVVACYRGWWCTKIPYTPCLENWPKNFKKEKKSVGVPPPPPPSAHQPFQDLRDFRGWRQTFKKIRTPPPPFSKSFLRVTLTSWIINELSRKILLLYIFRRTHIGKWRRRGGRGRLWFSVPLTRIFAVFRVFHQDYLFMNIREKICTWGVK